MNSSLENNRRILIVDVQKAVRETLRLILAESPSFRPQVSADGAKGPCGGRQRDRSAVAVSPETSARATHDAPLYVIDQAGNAREAVGKVAASLKEERPYSVALVNIQSPSLAEGLETAERLWRLDQSLQIIAYGSAEGLSWEQVFARFGDTDRMVLMKTPFEPAVIHQLVVALATKWQRFDCMRTEFERLQGLVESGGDALSVANEKLEREIAQRRRAEERLRHQAEHDPLTGLPNRKLLLERMRWCVSRAESEPDYRFAVLFLDVDNFNLVNESLGHRAGDMMLIEIARRIVAGQRSLAVRDRVFKDTAARIGGDEFVVVLDGISQATDAVLVAERIHERLSPPIAVGEHDLSISTSIGIAVSGPGNIDPEDLIRDADTAMYRAKQAGKAQHAVFRENMHFQAKDRLKLENALRSAIELEQLQVLYQPLISLTSGHICSFEALIRWHHPERGMISPAEFIPIAEDIGVIGAMGRWILQQACLQLKSWNGMLPPDRLISLNVNVSKAQLRHPGFIDQVDGILREIGVPNPSVNLEITESAIVEGSVPVEQQLKQLKDLGVRLHMDDFGTGYSSLSCLHRFPLDALKIDRAFVTTLEQSREYTAVIHAIMTLARNLGMKVTAEGIENADQLVQIISLDCDHAQGYLFSKPVDAQTATSLLTAPISWLERVALQAGCPPQVSDAALISADS